MIFRLVAFHLPHASYMYAYTNIEDIYFFEVITKYISLSVLKTSEFSRARCTSEKFNVFNSRDDIYLVFTENKVIFLFILYFLEDLRLIN